MNWGVSASGIIIKHGGEEPLHHHITITHDELKDKKPTAHATFFPKKGEPQWQR